MSPAIDGRCQKGDRVLAVIEPGSHTHYALVVINGGRVAVAIAGKDGELGTEQIVNSLVLRRTDGSEWLLESGAKIVGVFSGAPIDADEASACALREDVQQTGVEIEVVTLRFDL